MFLSRSVSRVDLIYMFLIFDNQADATPCYSNKFSKGTELLLFCILLTIHLGNIPGLHICENLFFQIILSPIYLRRLNLLHKVFLLYKHDDFDSNSHLDHDNLKSSPVTNGI